MRVKMIQAKSQEDKLKLQQRHDANVQKVGQSILAFFNFNLVQRALVLEDYAPDPF